MTSHQEKSRISRRCTTFRDRFHLPLSDEAVAQLDFYKPAGK